MCLSDVGRGTREVRGKRENASAKERYAEEQRAHAGGREEEGREKESRAETGRGPAALLLLIIIFIRTGVYIRVYIRGYSH